MDDHEELNAAYYEGRDDGLAMGAEELLAAMSPDVRKLVEYDAKFRLRSVMQQSLEQKAKQEVLRGVLTAQLVELAKLKKIDELRPQWGSW